MNGFKECEAQIPTFTRSVDPMPRGSALPVNMYLVKCRKTATATFTYTCVHKHVKTKRTCPDHWPKKDQIGCVDCLKNGHECPVEFTQADITEAGI